MKVENTDVVAGWITVHQVEQKKQTIKGGVRNKRYRGYDDYDVLPPRVLNNE
jgi:hypothetical protein